jgi:lipopolysaccharide export system permease protein
MGEVRQTARRTPRSGVPTANRAVPALAPPAGTGLLWAGLMRLLDRYLLREFAVPFFYCLSGFYVFWVSFDLLTQLDAFQRNKLSASQVLQYYLLKMPDQLGVVIPVALLLALLYALTNHARHNELTAMRATGISLWRVSLPYFAVGFLLAVATFFTNEFWLPDAVAAAERFVNPNEPKRSTGTDRHVLRNVGFSNTAKNRKWFIESYNLRNYTMIRPRIEWTLVTGTRREISADAGSWNGAAWVFTNVQELVYPPVKGALPGPPIETNLLVFSELSETPDEIAAEIKIARINAGSLRQIRKAQFSIKEILDYQARNPGRGDKSRVLDTKLHARMAAPFTCVVVVLIALPFGAMTGRRNVFVGVASSIVICFAYFVLVQVALALGTGGYVPPWLGAWGPNLFFAATGLTMTWRSR